MIVHAKHVIRGDRPTPEAVENYLRVLHQCEELHKNIRGARSRRRHYRLVRELFQREHYDKFPSKRSETP